MKLVIKKNKDDKIHIERILEVAKKIFKVQKVWRKLLQRE